MNKHEQNFLTYAVTLYFDDESSERLRELTKGLADVTGNNYMIQNDVPPHLTLGMFHVNEADEDKLKKLFGEFVEKARTEILAGKEFMISFGVFEDFVGKVIFRKIEKDELLAGVNKLLHDIFVPHFEAGDNKNYLPENWYPHITLSFKLASDQFEKGMEFLKGKTTLSRGRCVRIGLACCNPYTPTDEILI